MMKRAVVATLSAMTLLSIPMVASAYTCHAASPSATGWATYGSLGAAQRNALYQCAIRTPRNQTCRITRCSY